MTPFARTSEMANEQRRRAGGRGGRAYGRNLRLRRILAQAAVQEPPEPAAEPEFDPESVHEARLRIDDAFPHLRDAFDYKQKPEVPAWRRALPLLAESARASCCGIRKHGLTPCRGCPARAVA